MSASKNLNKYLLLFPCSAAKDPSVQQATSISKLLPVLPKPLRRSFKLARKQVRKAFRENFTKGKKYSALDLYTGKQYQVSGFKHRVKRAVNKHGLHCLIVSGGYGLVSVLDPILNYNVSIQQSNKYWRSVLPQALAAYIKQFGIKKVFVASSSSYLSALKNPIWRRDVKAYLCNPTVPKGEGGALTKVPRMVGEAVVELLSSNFVRSSAWKRWR